MNTASNDAVIDRIFAVAHEGEDADIAKRKDTPGLGIARSEVGARNGTAGHDPADTLHRSLTIVARLYFVGLARQHPQFGGPGRSPAMFSSRPFLSRLKGAAIRLPPAARGSRILTQRRPMVITSAEAVLRAGAVLPLAEI
jgi:hypothetical protein